MLLVFCVIYIIIWLFRNCPAFCIGLDKQMFVPWSYSWFTATINSLACPPYKQVICNFKLNRAKRHSKDNVNVKVKVDLDTYMQPLSKHQFFRNKYLYEK